ncbi:hypothetical protein HUU05_18885 [candidate division KSB1 bacterium]|nr:hypothetical protein [candidate division KSB1 bacterium]
MDKITIWIPIVSVLISVVTSVIITTLRNRTEVAKLRKQLEQQYAKSLFDKRLETYPKLYNVLSGYAKTIQYDQQTIGNLIQFRNALDEWDSQNALLHTEDTSRLAGKFRDYLKKLIAKSEESQIDTEELKKEARDIKKIIAWFEQTIRTEIGILGTLPPGEMRDELEEVAYKFIDEKRERLGLVKKAGLEKSGQEFPRPWETNKYKNWLNRVKKTRSQA